MKKESLKISVRNNLCKIPIANELITKRAVRIAKKNIKEIESYLNKREISMVSPKDFKYFSPQNYSHCNIWGSGCSAAVSKNNEKLTKDSFDIGIGFSYLLGIEFNFYFIENASKLQDDLVKRQKRGIKRFIDLENCPLLFKNLWESKNDINFAINSYRGMASFARDLNFPHYTNTKQVCNHTLDMLLKNDDDYFKQSCSTVLTSILFAKYIGFKKIVLNGVDFDGGYFFDSQDYNSLKEFRPPYFDGKLDIYNKKWRDQKKGHPTANCLYVFLPLLRNKLENSKIKLLGSLEESKLSNLLDTFL